MIGYPYLLEDVQTQANQDAFWGPNPEWFGAEVQQAMARMAPNAKLILVGKSLGACKLLKTARVLNSAGITVDLLVMIDGSCAFLDGDHSDETEAVPPNVKRVFNFRQDTNIDRQSGYQISCSERTTGHDAVVNKYSGFVGSQLCSSSVGHNSIDECPALLNYVGRVVAAEINGNMSAVLSLLLLN